MEIPRAALADPACAHVAAGIETIGRAINDGHAAGRVGTVGVAVPPADRIAQPLPGFGCRRRIALEAHLLLGGVDAPVPGEQVRGHRGLVRASLLRPRGLQLRDRHIEVVAMRAVGQDLAVILDELAVVPRAIGILMEVDAGHGRGVGDVEGHGARITLTAHG